MLTKTHIRIVVPVALAVLIGACGSASPPAPASPDGGPSSTGLPSATGGSGPSASASGSIGLPADFPVGAWTMTVTPDDLRAAGLTEQGAILENSGTFVLTFDPGGRWTVVQQAGDPSRWPVFRGRLAPTGERAFDATTEFPPEYAGEVVAHTWQLDGDELTIRVPESDDPVLKVNWEAHPWRRVPAP